MKNFFALIIVVSFFSCKKAKSQISNDNKPKKEMTRKNKPGEINWDDKFFEPGKKAIMDCDFKIPSKELFEKKMNQIFKIDIKEHTGAKALWLDYYKGEPTEENIAASLVGMLSGRYINYADGMDPDDIIPDHMCKFNKMIFYNDIQATNWFKTNASYAIVDLIKDNGDIKNKDLLKFVFNKIDLANANELEELLFGTYARGKDYKYALRKDMLDKMIEYGAELSQLSTVANRVSNGNPESYEEDTEELYAYLMAHCYKAGQSGIIEYLYDTDPKMIEVFRKKDFYGIEDLEDFTDNFYIPKNKRFGLSSLGPDPYIAYGVINDPDGYTNLRDGKGTSAKVIKKIKEGEKFAIETNTGDWWSVVTEDGINGWIHSSRIKVIEGFSFEMNYRKN